MDCSSLWTVALALLSSGGERGGNETGVIDKIEDLNDLAVFVEVAARRSFTDAARHLRLSPP